MRKREFATGREMFLNGKLSNFFSLLFYFLTNARKNTYSKDWYKGIITDEELAELENPKPRPKPSEEAVRRRQGSKKKPKTKVPEEE